MQKHLIIIHNLEGLRKYHPYLTTYNLYDNLRNGFAHSFVPKYPLTLSSKAERQHLTLHENNERLNLKCEDFYEDFKIACEEVLAMNFSDADDKMNRELLYVPKLEILDIKMDGIITPCSGSTSQG